MWSYLVSPGPAKLGTGCGASPARRRSRLIRS